jgi:hypothetical protein
LDLILAKILQANRLLSGEAASLAGKLGFSVWSAFGKIGRAQIRPIIGRSCTYGRKLTPALLEVIVWWRRFLKSYKPRLIPTKIDELPTIISYSDGEGSWAGVGAAVWAPWLQHPVAAYTRVPQELRDLWSCGKSEYNDIFQVEAIGTMLILLAFPKLVRRCMWLHFIDNTAAEASLISGTSRSSSASHVVAYTWELCAKRQVWPYFDRVASASNPVDKLSRGIWAGPWRRIVSVDFPVATLVSMSEAFTCELEKTKT